MTMSVEERLGRAAVLLDERIEQHDAGVPYLTDRDVRSVRPRRRTALIGAVAAAVLVLAIAAGTVRSDRDGSVPAPAAAHHPAGTEGWDRLPAAPLAARFQHLAVSTGTALLVWGGYGPDDPRTDGAFYDSATTTWRALPKAPLAGDRGDAVGTWTGTEVVVVNGIDGGVKAAAFDPASFAWRPLPDPPVANAANMMTRAVEVAGTVVVVTVSEEGAGGARIEVARLDLATGAWAIGEAPPRSFGSGFDAVAVGDEVVVVARRGYGASSCGESVVVAYRPVTDTWRNLPSGPTGDRSGMAVASTGTQVVAAGGHFCGEQTSRRETFLLDPATATWRQAAPAPTGVSGSDRYGDPWTGRWMVAAGRGGELLLYDPATDRWHAGPANPLGSRLSETPWSWVAGTAVVVGGGVAGADGGCCNPLDGGYAYTPPAIP